jgi:hypothetical protein
LSVNKIWFPWFYTSKSEFKVLIGNSIHIECQDDHCLLNLGGIQVFWLHLEIWNYLIWGKKKMKVTVEDTLKNSGIWQSAVVEMKGSLSKSHVIRMTSFQKADDELDSSFSLGISGTRVWKKDRRKQSKEVSKFIDESVRFSCNNMKGKN